MASCGPYCSEDALLDLFPPLFGELQGSQMREKWELKKGRFSIRFERSPSRSFGKAWKQVQWLFRSFLAEVPADPTMNDFGLTFDDNGTTP